MIQVWHGLSLPKRNVTNAWNGPKGTVCAQFSWGCICTRKVWLKFRFCEFTEIVKLPVHSHNQYIEVFLLRVSFLCRTKPSIARYVMMLFRSVRGMRLGAAIPFIRIASIAGSKCNTHAPTAELRRAELTNRSFFIWLIRSWARQQILSTRLCTNFYDLKVLNNHHVLLSQHRDYWHFRSNNFAGTGRSIQKFGLRTFDLESA